MKNCDLTIFTVVSGRTYYLERQIKSLYDSKVKPKQHLLVLNGAQDLPKKVREYIREYNISLLELSSRSSIGKVIELVKHEFRGSHILKLDDDAVPLGNFLSNLIELIKIESEASLSAFPVGLLKYCGGPKKLEDQPYKVEYSKALDTFYTLRPVHHLGGFCRLSPAWVYDEVELESDTHSEDKEFSAFCLNHKVPMYYAENALIVEHCETALGQKRRSPDYFDSTAKNRKRLPTKNLQDKSGK